MKQFKWTERVFRFGHSIEHLPLLLERLQCTAPRIEELVHARSEEELCVQPGGKWSVKQHIGHLTDLEALHEGRLLDYKAGKEVLRAADMRNEKTEQAEHNRAAVKDLIHDLRETRAAFIQHTLAFSEDELMKEALHPRLQQKVNVPDLLYFIAEHDLFHLVKIKEILQ